MRWLLLIMIFELTSTGTLRPRLLETRVYTSEETCNEFGRNYREIVPIDPEMKSFSICIPESAYDEGTQTHRFD